MNFSDYRPQVLPRKRSAPVDGFPGEPDDCRVCGPYNHTVMGTKPPLAEPGFYVDQHGHKQACGACKGTGKRQVKVEPKRDE